MGYWTARYFPGAYFPGAYYPGTATDGGTTPPTIPAGWPTVDDVLQRISNALRVPVADLPPYVTEPVADILIATIDGVESPIGEGGAGGTGRLFTPTPGTRAYDGTGGAVLEIDDVVPDTTLAVSISGTAASDVELLQPRWWWEGHRWLSRPNDAPYGLPGLFMPGYGNVTVEATFGYAATVPRDLWEAVAGEVARQAIMQGSNDLAGVGETISMGSFSITTSSGISVWADSSVLALWQQNFKSAIRQFRRRHPEPYQRRGW